MQYIEPKIFDNILDEQLIASLCRKYTVWYKTQWKSNRSKVDDYGHMSNALIPPVTDFPADVSLFPSLQYKHPELVLAWNKIQELIGPRALYRCYTAAYHYGMDAYIHTDKQGGKFGVDSDDLQEQYETIIVYLTPNWDLNWYGQTCLYEDDEIVLSCVPKYNRAFIFDNRQQHSSAPLARTCPEEKRILVFNSMPVDNCDQGFKYLIEHTGTIKHSGRTFFEHLWNVYQLLRSNNCPSYVRLAGLWHAVYGTAAFDNPTKGKFPRDLVKDFIGEEAEELVHRFCTMSQPRVTTILESHDIDLAWIEMANLSDQNFNGKHNQSIAALNLMVQEHNDT